MSIPAKKITTQIAPQQAREHIVCAASDQTYGSSPARDLRLMLERRLDAPYRDNRYPVYVRLLIMLFAPAILWAAVLATATIVLS